MRSQQFRNTKTGEAVTQVPLSQIQDFEQYDGPAAYYSAAQNSIIDLIDASTGRTVYGKKSRADVLAEHPDAVLLTLDEAGRRHELPFIEPVSEITEEKYFYWLEVLFPEDWQHGPGESFKVCERLCGDITRICACFRPKDKEHRYFTLCDSYKTPHAEIIKRCRAYMGENP